MCRFTYTFFFFGFSAAGSQRERVLSLTYRRSGGSLQDMEKLTVLFARDENGDNATLPVQDEQALIASLVRLKFQTVRTTNVILQAFGIAAVLLVAGWILQDARKASSLQVQLRPRYGIFTFSRKRVLSAKLECRKLDLFRFIHPAEKIALVIATVIAIQQTIFIVVGTSALDRLMVDGCSGTAQIILPGNGTRPRYDQYSWLIFCSNLHSSMDYSGLRGGDFNPRIQDPEFRSSRQTDIYDLPCVDWIVDAFHVDPFRDR